MTKAHKRNRNSVLNTDSIDEVEENNFIRMECILTGYTLYRERL